MQEVFVLCTIKDGGDMVMQLFTLNVLLNGKSNFAA
jgi:hypothetical protein